MKTLDQLVDKALSRRTFLAGAGAVAATTMVAGCSNDNSPSTSSTYTDADVLNFALNLEYLEAQFYLYAATGAGLASTDTAAPSGYTGSFTEGTVTATTAKQVAGLTTAQQEIINEIAYEEMTHVKFLRSALGAAAVPMPSLDLDFFGPLAVAATIETDPTAFSPYGSFDAFLIGSFIFEDVGVTAYPVLLP